MKALILTEGGSKLGFGHITRCLALYQGFVEKGITPKLIINSDISIKYLLRDENYRIFNWLKEKRKLFELTGNTDVVIIDSYLADKSLYDSIPKTFPHQPLLMLDDYKRIEYPAGIVINPSVSAEKLDYPKRKSLVYLLGKKYITLRREFWNMKRKKINPEIKHVLITFGGINRIDFIKKIVRFLISKFPNFYYHIVTLSPKFNRHNPFLSSKIKFYPRLTTLTMRNLMLKCDIAISGGGQTTYELARCGIPSIGICFAGNQSLNLKVLSQKGFLEYIGRYDEAGLLERLKEAVILLQSQKIRKKRSIVGRRLVDGEGVQRILSRLEKIKATKKDESEKILLKKATQKDCYDLWVWRNHPGARKWCFSKTKFDFKSHKSWFEKEMRDSKSKIYIAFNRKKEKIGQVRFRIDGKKLARINVNLNPEFFARNLGNKIIKKATEVFLKKNPQLKEIIAEIFGDNIASQKAFQKAGYRFQDNIFKSDRHTAILQFANDKF